MRLEERALLFGILITILYGLLMSSCAGGIQENIDPITDNGQDGEQRDAPPTNAPTETIEEEVQFEDVDCSMLALSNPAASNCMYLGYAYTLNDQGGVCTFPDDSSCDEWKFYSGECGQAFNYCGQQGYGTAISSNGEDPFSAQYAVCTDPDGKSVGTANQLSGLLESMEVCSGQ